MLGQKIWAPPRTPSSYPMLFVPHYEYDDLLDGT